jgi:mandelate racemase
VTVGTIARVRARGVLLIPRRPVETAAGVLRSTPVVLLDLTTSDGAVGRSYLRCYTPAVLQPLVGLVSALAGIVMGCPATPREVEVVLRRELKLIGVRGLIGMAIAGLDMALWDALAQTAGMPLATLLGGVPAPVPAYAGLRSMSPESAAAEAAEAVSAGFAAVKLKLGGGDLTADLASIRAVRRAVGDGTSVCSLPYRSAIAWASLPHPSPAYRSSRQTSWTMTRSGEYW